MAEYPGCKSTADAYMEELHSFVLRTTKDYSTEITEDFGANIHYFTSRNYNFVKLDAERIKKTKQTLNNFLIQRRTGIESALLKKVRE